MVRRRHPSTENADRVSAPDWVSDSYSLVNIDTEATSAKPEAEVGIDTVDDQRLVRQPDITKCPGAEDAAD